MPGDTNLYTETDHFLTKLKVDSDSPLTGKAAIQRFEGFIPIAQECARTQRILDTQWQPQSASEIAGELEEERLEELLAGASPTEEEEQLWSELCQSRQVYADLLSLYHLTGTTTEAWFILVTDGIHQGSESLEAAGPFWNRDEVTRYCTEKAQGWYAAWIPEADDFWRSFLSVALESATGKTLAQGW